MSFIAVIYLLKLIPTKGGEEILQSQFLVFRMTRKAKIKIKSKVLLYFQTPLLSVLMEAREFASLLSDPDKS